MNREWKKQPLNYGQSKQNIADYQKVTTKRRMELRIAFAIENELFGLRHRKIAYWFILFNLWIQFTVASYDSIVASYGPMVASYGSSSQF